MRRRRRASGGMRLALQVMRRRPAGGPERPCHGTGGKLKRLSSVVAALGLASAGLVAASPAAVASGSCSLYVPSKLALTAPERTITVKEGPNCAAAGVVSATWTPHHATAGDGPSVTFANSARSTTFLVEGWYPVGVWTWTPNGAYDAQHVSVYQYSPKTDVRLGSYGRVYPTRSGSIRAWADPVPDAGYDDVARAEGGLLVLQRHVQLHVLDHRGARLPGGVLQRHQQHHLGIDQPGRPEVTV